MQIFEQHLAQLMQEGIITPETALAMASDPSALVSSGPVPVMEPVI
jgi:Tfp pilus assembly pilus retraction ATPase PilT